LNSSFWPQHDVFRFFQTFYIFYNEFFFITIWSAGFRTAFTEFRVIFFQLNALSVPDYFVILVGSLLRIKDVLSLFLISMLIQQFLFIWYLFVVVRTLFKNHHTFIRYDRCFLPARYGQAKFFLISHFLFIAARFLFFSFIFKTKTESFWLAGITFVIAQLGASVFFVTLQALIWSYFFCFFLFRNMDYRGAMFDLINLIIFLESYFF